MIHMSVGTWNVEIVDMTTGSMPQKVATVSSAFTEKLGELLGAQYTPIAYLGSQVVNGTNHAILAEQVVITGRDTKNVVLVILNEKGNDFAIVNIERVVEGGTGLGGTVVDVKTEIPEDAKAVFDKTFEGFVGSKVEPFALLGTQVVKGTNYIFAAKVTPVTAEPTQKFAIVTVNGLENKATFADPLRSDLKNGLGYAFTW